MTTPNPMGAAAVTVEAEMRACIALRSYLLLALPGKVANINAGRFATLVSSIPGPFTDPGTLYLGTTVGSETLVTLGSGSQTTTQVAASVNGAALGIVASVDAYQRLVLTRAVAANPGVVSLSGDGTGNAAFGFPVGGQKCVLAPLTAPDTDGIHDGEPSLHMMGPGFIIVLGDRATAPRRNIRDDVSIVTLQMQVYAAEPNGSVDASTEFGQQCLRAVRESLLEDRTLLGRVHLVELPSFHFTARTFQFAGASMYGLMTKSDVTLKIHVYERS